MPSLSNRQTNFPAYCCRAPLHIVPGSIMPSSPAAETPLFGVFNRNETDVNPCSVVPAVWHHFGVWQSGRVVAPDEPYQKASSCKVLHGGCEAPAEAVIRSFARDKAC